MKLHRDASLTVLKQKVSFSHGHMAQIKLSTSLPVSYPTALHPSNVPSSDVRFQ